MRRLTSNRILPSTSSVVLTYRLVSGPSWQAVAIDLLRHRAGLEPRLSLEELRDAGRHHEAVLTRKRLDSLYFVACGIDHPRQRVYQALWNAQLSECRAVMSELDTLGTKPLLFKGAELGLRYDGERAVGERGDFDVLVPPDTLWKVKHALERRGYFQGNYDSKTREWIGIDHFRQLRHEANAYELWPYRKAIAVDGLDQEARAAAAQNYLFAVHDDVVLAIVKVDVHHNLLFNFDLQTFVARSIPSRLGCGRTLNHADHLWFAIHRYYGEVATAWKRTLRGLAWIAPMVTDPEIDWDQLVRTAIEHKSTSPCFYWLTFFRLIGAHQIPERVLQDLHAHRGTSERSWGWQLERLFEVDEVFPHAVLG